MQPVAYIILYAEFMRTGRFATPFLFAGLQNALRLSIRAGAMDVVYLLFLFVLSGATLGFLLACDRLKVHR